MIPFSSDSCHSSGALVPTTTAEGIENESSGGTSSDDPLVLPDIKDMLKKKEIEQEKERIEEEKRQSVKKIKRSDKEAFRKVSFTNTAQRHIAVV